jgi:hypothetical protein
MPATSKKPSRVPETATQVAAHKPNKNNELAAKNLPQKAALRQMPLDLGIEIQRDVDGIEMGVLENGIPYLTQRGLAEITGVNRSVIQAITKDWEDHFYDEVIVKDRLFFFRKYLEERGFRDESTLYIETLQKGTVNYAYPDVVCMAFLEYYAFESKGDNAVALSNYRKFAAFGLRRFIYDALEYTPEDKWRYYHDRVSLLKDSAPPEHFIVFQEVTGLIVDLIASDLTVNSKTIVDGSVGSHWAKHWKDNDMESKYGPRISFDHNYPSYYPQALSNPQPANAYPDAALPEFRRWFKHVYLLTKFPAYILTKANLLLGGKAEAIQIGSMYQAKALPSPKT